MAGEIEDTVEAPKLDSTQGDAIVEMEEREEVMEGDGRAKSQPDLSYEQRLYKHCLSTEAWSYAYERANTFVDFSDLRSINITHLQIELARIGTAVSSEHAAPTEMQQLDSLLHRYSKLYTDD